LQLANSSTPGDHDFEVLTRHDERRPAADVHPVEQRGDLRCERFVAFIGLPPMWHLTGWRMELASNLLRSADANVAASSPHGWARCWK